MHAYINAYTHIEPHTHTHMHTYACTDTHAHMCACTDTHIHTQCCRCHDLKTMWLLLKDRSYHIIRAVLTILAVIGEIQ